MNKLIKLACAAGTLSLLFAGCSSSDSKASSVSSARSSAASQVSSEVKKETLVLGTESADALKLTLTNSTGADITAISFKTAEDAEYPASLLAEGKVWKSGEEAIVYLPKTDGVLPEMTAHLISGDTDTTIDVFPAARMNEKAALKKDGETFYVVFEENGAEVSTLADEQAAKAPATDATPEAVPVEEPVEEPVYTDPEYVDPGYVDPGYQEDPVYVDPQAPVDTPAAPSQGEDVCLIPAPAE